MVPRDINKIIMCLKTLSSGGRRGARPWRRKKERKRAVSILHFEKCPSKRISQYTLFINCYLYIPFNADMFKNYLAWVLPNKLLTYFTFVLSILKTWPKPLIIHTSIPNFCPSLDFVPLTDNLWNIPTEFQIVSCFYHSLIMQIGFFSET